MGGSHKKGAAREALAITKARSTTPLEDTGPVASHTQHRLASAIQGCWEADKAAAYVWLMNVSARTVFDTLSNDLTTNTGSNSAKPSPNRTNDGLEPNYGHTNCAPENTAGKESKCHTVDMCTWTSRSLRHFQYNEACCSWEDDT